MENMEEEPPTTPPQTSPFWLQPTTAHHQSRLRLLFRPRFPSPTHFLSTGFFVVILCISAIVFLVLVIPSLLSLTHQVFKPSSVRKGWDSLNLVLVLFAIVCGFLGRRNHEDQPQRDQDLVNSFDVTTPQSPLRSHQQYSNWYDYEYCESTQGNVTKLRRTSSSYPDLRQEISWDVEYDHRPRYYDDSYATNEFRPPIGGLRSRWGIDGDEEEADTSLVKEIHMDNVTPRIVKELAPSSPPSTPMLPPPTPTPPMYYSKRVRKPPRKEYEAIGRRGRKVKEPPPPPLPPPLAPLPPLDRHQWEDSHKKSGKSVTKDILTSIYNQSKRKNKLLRRKSHENLKEYILLPPSPPPPPPPPPPPTTKFHNNFSPKKAKSVKKTTSSFTNTHPIFSPKATKFDDDHETTDSGYESPTIPIPPPPPPPPFKMHPWKFAVHGDYVKITSSPKRGDVSGGDEFEFEDSDKYVSKATPPVFCPSPDVNTKADDFIARFKATLIEA